MEKSNLGHSKYITSEIKTNTLNVWKSVAYYVPKIRRKLTKYAIHISAYIKKAYRIHVHKSMADPWLKNYLITKTLFCPAHHNLSFPEGSRDFLIEHLITGLLYLLWNLSLVIWHLIVGFLYLNHSLAPRCHAHCRFTISIAFAVIHGCFVRVHVRTQTNEGSKWING